MSGNSPFYKLRNAQGPPLLVQAMLEQCGPWEKRSRRTEHQGDFQEASRGSHPNGQKLQKREIYPRGMDLPPSLSLSTTRNATQDRRRGSASAPCYLSRRKRSSFF